jgi:uncharacterized protein YneF (UPF0154 family)
LHLVDFRFDAYSLRDRCRINEEALRNIAEANVEFSCRKSEIIALHLVDFRFDAYSLRDRCRINEEALRNIAEANVEFSCRKSEIIALQQVNDVLQSIHSLIQLLIAHVAFSKQVV